jgi:hypothetical protein
MGIAVVPPRHPPKTCFSMRSIKEREIEQELTETRIARWRKKIIT